MIISRTPYRISFFGGGTDYQNWYKFYQSEIISTTINKYLYLSLRKLPPFFKKRNRIVYSEIEETNFINEIRLKPLRKILLKEKIINGVEIHYDGQMPAKSGVGSSSAFVIGILNLCNSIKNKKQDKYSLAKNSIYYEQKILKEVVGIQDQIAITFGGFNHICINKNGNFIVKPIFKDNLEVSALNKNLVLIYTGIQKLNKFELSNYVKNLRKNSKDLMFENLKMTAEAKKLLLDKKFDDFGRLLHHSWDVKKKISSSISNTAIDEIYSYAKKNGALGGKLLGAGGGGFLLFYVPSHKKNFFLNKFNKFININFDFEFEGSKIIYKNLKNEKYF